MCAAKRSSASAEDLKFGGPDVNPQLNTSTTVAEFRSPQEEIPEPEAEIYIPCMTRSQTKKPFVQDPEVITEYVLAMRAAIEKQGERLRAEAAERESANEGKDAVAFHVKVVKHKPVALILNAKVHECDFLGRLKSEARQLTFAFPSRKRKEISKPAIDRPNHVFRSGPKTLVKAPTPKQSYT
jgi:hypothetical protein